MGHRKLQGPAEGLNLTLCSGENVLVGGVYSAAHLAEHHRDGSILLQRGEVGPRCPVCGAVMEMELLKAVPRLRDDPDFA